MPLLPTNSDSPQMGDSCPPSCSPSSLTPRTDAVARQHHPQDPVVILARELERESNDAALTIGVMLIASGDSVPRWKAEYDDLLADLKTALQWIDDGVDQEGRDLIVGPMTAKHFSENVDVDTRRPGTPNQTPS